MRREFITFAAGAVLSAAGLAPIPVSEAFLTAGAALISLSYGAVILGWRTGKSSSRLKLPGVAPTPSPSTQPSTPGPQPAYTPPPPPTPSPTSSAPPVVKPSVTPSPPSPPPSPPSMTPPPPPPPTPASPGAPSPPTVQQGFPSYAAPAPPATPSFEQPKPPRRKLPALKAPKIQLPKSVVENKVPVALLGAGLIVLIAGLLVLGIPPQPLVGIGLLIPGGLFFGLGAILLYQRLRPSVVEVVTRRFCMHCGFQMSSTDVSCPRCRRQPPSGVDTKVCPNCEAVIPTQAKFCRECGAGQPAA